MGSTTRAKNAKQTERVAQTTRELRDKARERQDALLESAKLPDKDTPRCAFTTLTGATYQTSLSAITVATAMAQSPQTVLEIPLVNKRGKVSAGWFRAGSLLSVEDLTGMRAFPR